MTTWTLALMPSGAMIATGDTCKCDNKFDHEVTANCGSKYENRLAAISTSSLSFEAQLELAVAAKRGR